MSDRQVAPPPGVTGPPWFPLIQPRAGTLSSITAQNAGQAHTQKAHTP